MVLNSCRMYVCDMYVYFYTQVVCFYVFFRTLAMIKPDAVTKIGDIIQMIYDANLIVTKAKMTKLTW